MSDGASTKSWLDELNDLIDELAKRINTHRDRLVKSESTTRYALIDPLLSKIGWNLADPSQVLTEYTPPKRFAAEKPPRLDYAMWSEGRVCLVVEAKPLDKDLGDEESDQAMAYCFKTQCQHYVVTNGKQWTGYDLDPNLDVDEQRVFDFSVTEQREIMELLWLWPGNFRGKTARPRLHQKTDEERPSVPDRLAPLPPSPRVGTPLGELVYKKGMSRPHRLAFPGGTTTDLFRRWARIQPATVEWLIHTGRLESLPLQNKRGTYLVNKAPTRANGDQFLSPREVRDGVWIDTHFAPANHLKKAQEILEACGIDPSTVRVELE